MATIKKQKAKENTNIIVHEMRIISIDRSVKDISSWRMALVNAESIYYPNRTRLYDLYEDVKLDAFLWGIINKRLDSVLNKKMVFINADQEVDGMELFLKTKVFRDIKKNILLNIFWGITGMEFIPGKEMLFEPIPRKHIKPEIGIIVPEQSMYEDGWAYANMPNIWVIGDKRDYGLLLQCSPCVLYKKGNYSDWAQYIEIFGQPVRVAKYDANDIKTKQELKKAIDEAGSSLAIMLPKQAEFEILDGKATNANGDLQSKFKDALNDELAILVLGNTETTSNSHGGSNAKAKEHGKQQLEVTKSDMDYLLTQLNSPQFIAICKSYGLPVEGGEFKFEPEIDLTALSQKIIIDQAVATQEPIAADYWYDTYGIPKPDNYDELKKAHTEAKQPIQLENEPAPSNDPKNKKNALNNNAKEAKLSAWKKLRTSLADFFDPAPLK